MRIDLHNHSIYSYDSQREMENIVIEAISKNLDGIGFSDHLDFNKSDPGNRYYKKNEQKKLFSELKSKYSDNIKLFLGIEASLEPDYEMDIFNTASINDFDYRIYSCHFINGIVISDWIDIIEKDKSNIEDVDYSPYFEACRYIADNGDFEIFGHLDYYKKYSKFRNHDYTFTKHKNDYELILSKIINRKKIIEINSSGLRYECNEQFPSQNILKLYKNLGGRVVSTGSDSHSIGQVAFSFEEVYNLVDYFNFELLNL